MKKILILCSGNSCRSQMAEALFNKYGEGKLEVVSAGLEPKPVHPLTIEAMKEIGIDISGNMSKSVKEFLGKVTFDYIIFVCDRAERNCPHIYPSVSKHILWPLQDPAEAIGTKEERLAAFRIIRDNISELVNKWLSIENYE